MAINYISGKYQRKDDVIDNLTSTDIDKPLSANQGKILDDRLTVIEKKYSVDISRLGVQYNTATDENTDKIQLAFEYCNANKIILVISDNIIATKTLTLPQSLNIKAIQNARFCFIPTNSDTCLFNINSGDYYIGIMDGIHFNTHLTELWTYNKTYSVFNNVPIKGATIKNCTFRSFNIVFNSCTLEWVAKLFNNTTMYISDSIFKNCLLSDVHIFENYFNGGRPITDDGKGYLPYLFYSCQGGLVNFQNNWVEFVKSPIPQCERSDIVGNSFDYVYDGFCQYNSNINDNIFSNVSRYRIKENFKNGNVATDFIDELNSPICTLKAKIGVNICNNVLGDRDFVRDVDGSTFIVLDGDENAHCNDINIKNITCYDIHKCSDMRSLVKYNDFDHKTTDLKNININIFEGYNFDTFEESKIIYNAPFKLKNEIVYPINYFDKSVYPYPILLDNDGNFYNFRSLNVAPKFNSSNWVGMDSRNWTHNNNGKSVTLTPISTGYIQIYTDIPVSNLEAQIMRIKPLDEIEIKIQFYNSNYSQINSDQFVYGEKILVIPSNAAIMRVCMQKDVTQSDLDAGFTKTYRLPVLNYFKYEPLGKLLTKNFLIYNEGDEIIIEPH